MQDFRITVTILTKNSEKYLHKLLDTLRPFDEVLILDNGSTDATLTIASAFSNVSIHKTPFIGFGPLHNLAAEKSRHDWILSLDSDEIPSPELINEIFSLPLDPHTIYSFPRNNFYKRKQIKWCGWYPEKVTRLYNRLITHFSNDQVHEKIILQPGMHEKPLLSAVNHYPYTNISDFLKKMEHYSTLFAEQNRGKNQISPLTAIYHSFFAFFKSYILKRGFMGGYEGFLISAYKGHTALYKYLKLYEQQKK